MSPATLGRLDSCRPSSDSLAGRPDLGHRPARTTACPRTCPLVGKLNCYLRVLRTNDPVGLFQPTESGRDPVSEGQLRPIVAELDWGKQRETAAAVPQNNAGIL
jgi:hypothetical protein